MAALLLMLAGCESESQLHVTVSASGVSAELIAADGDCSQRPLLVGECRPWSDVADGRCEQCESRCSELSATRSHDRSVVLVEGCGERVELEIPTQFPAQPVLATSAEGFRTRVTWQVDATTTSLTIAAGNPYSGEQCRIPTAPERPHLISDTWLYDGAVGAAAHIDLPERETPFGTAHVIVSSSVVELAAPPR